MRVLNKRYDMKGNNLIWYYIEFTALSDRRQMLRDKFNDYEIDINSCVTYEEAMAIIFEIN